MDTRPLLPAGCVLRQILGDGNCLFRALNDQIEGHSRNHMRLRHDVVLYMRQHREDFEPFVETDQPFEEHLRQLSEPGTYAGHDALMAFARLKKFNIIVHTDQNPVQIIGGSRYSHQLHLFFRGEHYSSVRLFGDDTETPAFVPAVKHLNLPEPESRTEPLSKELSLEFRQKLQEKNGPLVKMMMSPAVKDRVFALLKGELWTPRCDAFLTWFAHGTTFSGRPKVLGPFLYDAADDEVLGIWNYYRDLSLVHFKVSRHEWPLDKFARERQNPLSSEEFVETVVFMEVMKYCLMELYDIEDAQAEDIVDGASQNLKMYLALRLKSSVNASDSAPEVEFINQIMPEETSIREASPEAELACEIMEEDFCHSSPGMETTSERTPGEEEGQKGIRRGPCGKGRQNVHYGYLCRVQQRSFDLNEGLC